MFADKEKVIDFGNKLEKFLIKELGNTPERECLMSATLIMKCSIDVLYQNSNNKTQFVSLTKETFNRILTMYMEALCRTEEI